jgi:hypothetical protein
MLETDLETATGPFGDRSELPALTDGDGEWFLAVHVQPGLERGTDRARMEGVRRRDDDSVDEPGSAHLVEVGEGLRVGGSAGCALERLRPDVADGCELDVFLLREGEQVEHAHPGHARDAQPDGHEHPR